MFKKLKKKTIFKKLKRKTIYKLLKKPKIWPKLKMKKIYKKYKKINKFLNLPFKCSAGPLLIYNKFHSPEIEKILLDDMLYNINIGNQNENFYSAFKHLDGHSRYYINMGLHHWRETHKDTDWCWIKDRVSRGLDTDWEYYFEKYDWREHRRQSQAKQMKLKDMYNKQENIKQKLIKQNEYMNLMGIKDKELEKEIVKTETVEQKNSKVTMEDYGLNKSNFFPTKSYFDKFSLDCLESLIEGNIFPDYTSTFRIIEYWNELDNEKISRITVKKSIKLNKICAVLTFLMFTYDLNYHDVVDGIDNYLHIVNYSKLKYKKKYYLDTSFIYPNIENGEKDYFQLCCTKTFIEIMPQVLNIPIKYPNTLIKRIIPTFIEYYHPNNKSLGLQEVYSNYRLFVKFSDQLCTEHQSKNMEGWQDLQAGGLDSLIDAYFKFTKENIVWKESGTPPVGYILSEKLKTQFIRFIREYQGWEHFWNDL